MIVRRRGIQRSLQVALLAAVSLAVLIAASSLPGRSSASSPPVAVFPIPGSHVVSPGAQIAFRGVPAGQLGAITVTGSRSGAHPGTVAADSDGRGGSFLPAMPFLPGETVTVQTNLNVQGATAGAFQFIVATPLAGVPPAHWPAAARATGDVWQFWSRPDLAPASVSTSVRGRTAPGDVFVAPQYGPIQDGPMILDQSGALVWFKSLPGNDSAADFREQTYHGKPVLTWWQGYVQGGVGVGDDVINDASYQQIAEVHAANGLSADLHEFDITPQGTALITAEYPVHWDLSPVHGLKNGSVFDSVVQEIDIPTGLVLFQWDSLDHVSVTDSYQQLPKNPRFPYDYFHINSVEPDNDGTLVISGRNTWAAYKLDHRTGATIWILGGKRSTFRMGAGASFAFQHDVRVRAGHDLFVTLFDDGAGPPNVHSQSRGLKLFLDLKHRFAKAVGQDKHSPPLLAGFEGNYQQLAPGEDFLGWGQQPYFTEYNSHDRVVFDGHFIGGNASYRAYRFRWAGSPQTPPAVAARRHGPKTNVYASWNGATNVAAWRVLAGGTPTSLRDVATAPKRGFETSIPARVPRYVAVQALDSRGHTLATSAVVRAR